MPELLTDEQISAELQTRPEWAHEDTALVRTVKLDTFPRAIEVVDQVAVIAEELDHHPDIDIRWRTLRFSVSTHSKGGVTQNDLALVDRIDTVLAGY
ncbi:4a-hydroxytetrahydrobiopterin dehydratase [Haloechinothrix sp. YIM 98757]|uniref:Putative pterin-4-alpha-carbinolamine dehydratase n=1 Tax=Haloechinothrix aidingensis TaxID=2752311 RepID=A0A837ZXN5_9PSEU|nr:4a-hydroxytetrahydrobiopterin dehydratase [Haloechinothrix aidingensis]MBA0125396.1 4a-hydroxytetrahydrobiopterin dehydratase [Haloechinothrix aidingensis]